MEYSGAEKSCHVSTIYWLHVWAAADALVEKSSLMSHLRLDMSVEEQAGGLFGSVEWIHRHVGVQLSW